jgi:hypothetical protein
MKNHLHKIEKQLLKVKTTLSNDPILQKDIDSNLPFLLPYSKAEKCADIKLIIIGQDPTIRNIESRKTITATLNLDKNNSLRTYLGLICNKLQINIDNEVYATNLYKCFFTYPPADNESILTRHFKIWADLLINEISVFQNPIIISLGEPLIKQLIHTGKNEVKFFWDYMGNTKSGNNFKAIESNNNYLQKRIYPVAHQPTWSQNKFYKDHLEAYLNFVTLDSKN